MRDLVQKGCEARTAGESHTREVGNATTLNDLLDLITEAGIEFVFGILLRWDLYVEAAPLLAIKCE